MAPVERREQPPQRAGDVGANVKRQAPDQPGEQAQGPVFHAVLEIGEEGGHQRRELVKIVKSCGRERVNGGRA
jgi:hypothetical protein